MQKQEKSRFAKLKDSANKSSNAVSNQNATPKPKKSLKDMYLEVNAGSSQKTTPAPAAPAQPINQPPIFSNPSQVPTPQTGRQGFSPLLKDMPTPPSPVPMPGTVGGTLDQFMPELPKGINPTETPSYSANGQSLTREQTAQTIKQSESAKNLGNLGVMNDPELERIKNSKILEAYNAPKPVAQAQKPKIDKAWYEDFVDGIHPSWEKVKSLGAKGISEAADLTLAANSGSGGVTPYLAKAMNYLEQKRLQASGIDTGIGAGLREYAADRDKEADELNETRDTESWGYKIGSVVPYTAGILAAVVTKPISAPVAGAIGLANVVGLSAVSFGSGIETYDEYKKDKGQESDPLARLGMGALYGSLEFGMERFALSKFIPASVQAKLSKSVIDVMGAGPVVEKTAKDLITDFANSSQSRATLVEGVLKSAERGFVIEGSTESATTFGQEFSNYLFQERKDWKKPIEILKESGESYVLGGVMGVAIGPISFAANRIENQQRRSAAQTLVFAEMADNSGAVEIVGPAKSKPKTGQRTTASGSVEGTIGQEMFYNAIRANGTTTTVSENDINRVFQIKPETFTELLKGKSQGQALQENRANEAATQSANQESDTIRGEYQAMTFQGQDGVQMISAAQFNGEKVFVTAMFPDGNAVIQKPGEEKKVVSSLGLSEQETMPFDQFIETFGPVPEQTQVFDPANPIQIGEKIPIDGQEFKVSSVNLEEGIVQLENEDGTIFETIPVADFQQFRQPQQAEAVPQANEGAEKLRGMFTPKEDITPKPQQDEKISEEGSVLEGLPGNRDEGQRGQEGAELRPQEGNKEEVIENEPPTGAQESTVDNTIAADYLLTGGIGTILSTDYLLKGISGVFSKADKKITEIRNRYAKELAEKNLVDIKNLIGTETYNRMISEIREVIGQDYNGSEEIQSILDEVLKFPTGMPQRIGNQIESRLDRFENSQNEPATGAITPQSPDAPLQPAKPIVAAAKQSTPKNVPEKPVGQRADGEVQVAKRGEKQINKGMKDLREGVIANDPIKILNALNTLQRNIDAGAEIDQDQSDIIEKMTAKAKAAGYEIVDLKGQKFNEGMRLIVSSSIEDKTLSEGVEIITKVLKPQINGPNGKMIQAAEVIVSVGIKPTNQPNEPAVQQAKPNEEQKGGVIAPLAPKSELKDSLSETARKQGFKEKDGVRYDRQKPIEGPKGKEVNLEFSKDISEKASYAVIESAQIQPSHKKGAQNVMHFIPEAQPKNRKTDSSQESARKIADKLDPEKISQSPNPYSGAPIVNSRGEVIQGNNRSDAIQQYWENSPKDPSNYRKYLVDNAVSFGLNPDDIQGMKNPVLVRMTNISDARAIELGNYDVKDIESGGERGIDPITTTNKMSKADKKAMLNFMGQSSGNTLTEIVRDQVGKITKYLYDKGIINSTQLETILNKATGEVKPNGIEDISNIYKQFIFQGGDTNIPELFNAMPDRAQKALEKSIPDILNAPTPILSEIQDSITALNQFSSSGVERFSDWINQPDMFMGGIAPSEKFSRLSLSLVKKYDAAKTQTEIAKLFKEYNSLTTGTPGDLLRSPVQGISPKDAVKQVFGIDHDPIQFNVKDGDTKQIIGSDESIQDRQEPEPARGSDGVSPETKPKQEPGSSSAGTKPKVKAIPIGAKGVGNNTSESLKAREEELKARMKAKLAQFGKNRGNLTTGGITQEDLTLIGEIITDASELGIVKFNQLMKWIAENMGNDFLKQHYKALKATYVQVQILNDNPENEDFNEIFNSKVEDSLFEEEKAEAEPAKKPIKSAKDLNEAMDKPKPSKKRIKDEQQNLSEKPKTGKLPYASNVKLISKKQTEIGIEYKFMQDLESGGKETRVVYSDNPDIVFPKSFQTAEDLIKFRSEAIDYKNPNQTPLKTDKEDGKQGQGSKGQVGEKAGTGPKGPQPSNVSGSEKDGQAGPVRTGQTGTGQSNDGQAEGAGVRPDNSRGNGKSDSDGGNSKPRGAGNTNTDKFSGSSKSEVEERASRKKKNKENFKIDKGFEYPDTFKPAERFDQNIKAMELLTEMIEQGRTQATPEEKQILFAYSGFGGLSDVARDPSRYYERFDSETQKNRVIKVQELVKRLDPDGSKRVFETLKASINTAHFTEPEIIRAHYDLLAMMGFQSGKILDPSSGIGNYFGSMPESMMVNSTLTGVEMDYFTAEIFRRLYPGSKMFNQPLQESSIGENSQDLTITNIPFGTAKLYDPSWKGKKQPIYRTSLQKIHNYFVVKMIESTKEGGLSVILTSSSVLDTPGNQSVRQYMADNTRFIGAVRLPNTAFKGASGTKVVTDIIFLQKRKAGEAINQTHQFVESKEQKADGSKFSINEYFITNPQNILGEIKGGGQYSNESGYTVDGSSTDLRSRIVKALSKDAKTVSYTVSQDKTIDGRQTEAYKGDKAIRAGNVFEKNGAFYEVTAKDDKGGLIGEKFNVFKKYEQPFRDFIEVRNILNELIDQERFGLGDEVLNPLRKKLQGQYNAFYKAHGRLNEYKNDFSNDIDSYQVIALELIDQKGKFKGLADIFSKRTINPDIRPTKADSPQEAILISLNEYNRINPVRMQELIGEDWVAQSKGMLFELPNGSYESRDQYLSGNIFEKIEQVKDNPKFSENLEELEKVLPIAIPIELIAVPLGARYVNTETYSEFLREVLGYGSNLKVNYLEGLDSYKINARIDSKEFKTNRVESNEIIEKAFSDQTIRVNDTINNGDGTTTTVFNPVETAAAAAAIEKFKTAWRTWLAKNKDKGDEIAATYNRLFNSTVKRKFDGKHMNFPGLRGVKLRPHQSDAINMIIQNNGGVIDHIVGAGKTFIMVAGAMELKRLGVAKKPLIIGKKSTVPQIAEAFMKAYPGAKILAPSETDFSAAKRKKILSQIAINDWDAIILTHENFGNIEPDPETARQVIDDEIELLRLSVEDMQGGSQTPMTRTQIKGLEKRIENLEAKLKKLSDTTKDKEIMDFGKLGIDHIMVDESQSFKNLNYSTVHNNVAGLGSKEGAQKTFNLLMGIRHLQKIHKGDKGTTFLSGTPISNTMAELYLILKYLRPQKLVDIGISTFDSWAKTFAEKTNELEFGVSGMLKAKERFRRFVNVPELAKLYTDIADVRNDSNLKLPKPRIKGGKEDFVLIKPSKNLEQFYKKLIYYASTGNGDVLDIPDFDSTSDAAKKAKMLKVTDLATKASIDLRLIYPDAPYDPTSKLAIVAADVAKQYKEASKHKGVSLVFMDSGKTSQYNLSFNGEQEIKRILVEEYKIPAIEIQLMTNHKTDKKKEVLFPKVNSGEIRILIGSTETMGTGVNVQERIVSLHHVDIPWRPSDYEQRNGRALRQGNLIAEEFYNNEVDVKVYGVERSLDAYKFELLSIKQAFIDQIKSGATADRIMDEGEGDEESGASFAEFMAAATGNPVIKEKAKNDKLLDQLSTSRQAFNSSIGRASSDIKRETDAITNSKAVITQLDKYNSIAQKSGILDEYPITVKGKKFEKVTQAGEALLKINPYTEQQLDGMKRGGETVSPHASVLGWDLYLFNKIKPDGGKTVYYQIAVNDTNGRRLYPDSSVLSGSPVYAINTIKSYTTTEIKYIIDRNEQRVKQAEKSIGQAEKVIQEVWPDEAKYQKALQDQERIAEEVTEMNKLEGESNKSDEDVFRPMFQDAPNPDDVRFSKPSTASDLNRILDGEQKPTKKAQEITDKAAKFTENWNNAPEIVVLQNSKEALAQFPDLAQQYSEEDLNQVPALFIKDATTGEPKAVLIASHSYLSGKGAVEKAILHEVIGHYGVREFLKQQANGDRKKYVDSYVAFMQQVFDAKKADPVLADISQRYFGKKPSELSANEQTIIGDEYLAKLAEDGVQDQWIDRAITKFRQILRDLGITLGLSDSEIRAMLGNSRRIVMGPNGSMMVREGIDETNLPREMIIGEKGARNLDQQEEATIRIDNLGVAREMEAAKKDAATIRLATGWEKGADGKWRYEVMDIDFVENIDNRLKASEKARTKNGVDLVEFVNDNNLFKAYPALRWIKVVMDNKSGSYGSFNKLKGDGGFGQITINPDKHQNDKQILSTLLHEIQHAIQQKEGFASGGNINDVALKEKLSAAGVKTREELNEKIKTLKSEYKIIYNRWEDRAFAKRYKGQTEESRNLLREWQRINNQIKDLESNTYDFQKAFRLYQRIAGEVESRNVESRANLSLEERRTQTLQSTEDVSREDQIFLENASGPAMSMTQPQTQSAAFKKWFGDSKIVDSNGEPLVVYHGTDKDISTFNTQGSLRPSFFSSSAELGQKYAQEKSKKSGLNQNNYPVYLHISNPMIVDANGSMWDSISVRGIENNDNAIRDLGKKGVNEITTNIAAKIAEKSGFDGVVIKNVFDAYGYNRDAPKSTIYAVFSPTQIKSATGNSGAFDGENSDIRFMKVGSTQADFTAINVRNFNEAKLSWFERKVIEPLQDRMIRSKKLIQSKTNGNVSDAADFYTKENLASGKTLEKARVFKKDLWNPLIKTANKIKNATGLTPEDISNYLKFKHHGERKAYFIEEYTQLGKEIPTDDKWPTGMTDEEAADGIAAFETSVDKAMVDQLNQQVRAISHYTSMERYQSGMITKETFDDLMTRYENYVPLTDWSGMESTNDKVYTLLMSAKGRTSESADPLPFLFTAAQEAIMRGEKNRTKQSVLEFVKENVDPGRYFIRNAFYLNTKSKDENGNDIWIETMNKPTAAQMANGDAMRSFDPAVHRHVQQQGDQVAVLDVMVKGKKVFIEFKDVNYNDPKAAKYGIVPTIKNMNQDQVPGFFEKLRPYTRWLSSMYTQYSPEFGIRNLIRDVGFGTFNILVEQDATIARKTIGKMGKSAITLGKFLKNEEYPTGKDGQMLREFMEEGALTGYTELQSAAEVFAQTKKEIDKADKEGIWRRGGNAAIKPIQLFGQGLEIYNKTMENSMRFSYYKTLREEGMSKQQSAAKAKDLTVNFNRKGRSSGVMGTIFIFFNASVQGTERLARSFTNPKTAKKALGYAGGIMAAGMMQSLLLGMLDEEDEDGRSYYEKIPDYVRKNHVILPNLFSDTPGDYIKIPLPYGLNIFYAFGESIGRTMMGKSDIEKEAMGMLGASTNVFSPIGGYDFTSDQNGFQQAMMLASPSVIQPLADLGFNRNFAGRPIYRENFTTNQFKLPDSQMYFEGVNPFIKESTTFMNKISGGNEVVSGKIDINPEWLEYGMEQYLGGPVQFTKNIATTVAEVISGENILEDPFIRKVPFVRSFVQKTGSDFEARASFYENRDKAITAVEAFEKMQEAGLSEDAAKFYEKNKGLIGLSETYKGYETLVKDLNKLIGEMKSSDKELYKDDIEKLYEDRTKIMRGFNRKYGEVMYKNRPNPIKEILNMK